MTIKFNSDAAEQLGISLDQAVCIVLYDHGIELSPSMMSSLQNDGILLGNHVSKVVLDRLNGEIITGKVDNSVFKELLEVYPKFDHLRPLQDVSEKVRQRYLKKVSSDPELHNLVIAAIKREIKYRALRLTKGEFVESWKNLSKYIDTEGWNRYSEELPEDKIQLTPGYGEQEL